MLLSQAQDHVLPGWKEKGCMQRHKPDSVPQGRSEKGSPGLDAPSRWLLFWGAPNECREAIYFFPSFSVVDAAF